MEARGRREVKERRRRGRRLNGMRLLRYGGIGEKKGEKETGRISRSQTIWIGKRKREKREKKKKRKKRKKRRGRKQNNKGTKHCDI